MYKKRICFFLHHFAEAKVPLYVQYYINELIKYFDEVRLVTNHRTSKFRPSDYLSDIQIIFVKNQGYDFGMFYTAFKDINPEEYTQIAVVNDSNLLINRLDFIFNRAETDTSDFWGMVDSNESPWFSIHKNNYHIQSHFLVFNEPAIVLLKEYFQQIKPERIFDEKNKKQLRRLVIQDWEIGISRYFYEKGLIGKALFSSDYFIKKYKSKGKNITHALYEELLIEGYPLIKNKVIKEKKFNLFNNKSKIKKLIEQYGNPEWDLSAALDEIL